MMDKSRRDQRGGSQRKTWFALSIWIDGEGREIGLFCLDVASSRVRLPNAVILGAVSLAASARPRCIVFTSFQHVSLVLCIIILLTYTRDAHNPRTSPASAPSALSAPHTRPATPRLSISPSLLYSLLIPSTAHHPLTNIPVPTSPLVPYHTPRFTLPRSRMSTASLYTLSDVSSRRTLSHPLHVHPTRDVPRPVSLLAPAGAVVMPNASTPLSIPMDGHPSLINSPGSPHLRCQVLSIVISQTFLSCLSTRLLLHFQTPYLLLDLCVAEKHLCARIPSRVAMSLPLASHPLGNIL